MPLTPIHYKHHNTNTSTTTPLLPLVPWLQLSRSMFSQPSARSPPPAPLTNHHLARVARLDAAARSGGGGGGGGRGGRPARSEAATSVRGGRGVFSVVSDEEQIEVDGEGRARWRAGGVGRGGGAADEWVCRERAEGLRRALRERAFACEVRSAPVLVRHAGRAGPVA